MTATTALTNALASKFNTTGALTAAITGGMFKDKAPEGTTFPYCVYSVPSAPSTSNFGTSNDYSQTAVRFNIYGVGDDVVGGYMDTLHATFRNYLPTLSVGQCTNIVPMTQPTSVKLDEVNEAGQEVIVWTVTYVYSIRS